MRKLYYKGIIEDVQNEKCTDKEHEILLEIFTCTVKRTAATLARKAWFDLRDFASAREHGLSGFALRLERDTRRGEDKWSGIFEKSGKKLKILARMERD